MNTPFAPARRAAAITLIVFLTGMVFLISSCGTERQHAQMPNRDRKMEARPKQRPEKRPVPPPPSPGVALQLQGPRSQSEIDNAFRPIQLAPPVASIAPPPAPMISDSGPVVAESGW